VGKLVAVIEADRTAAAAIVRWQRDATAEWETKDGTAMQFFVDGFSRGIMQGIWDEHPVVQSYAAARIAATSTLQAQCERQRVALELIISNDTSSSASLVARRALAAPASLDQEGQQHGAWIDWTGGECPVSDGAIVEVRFLSGVVSDNDLSADHYDWLHTEGFDGPFVGNIVAYRAVSPC